MKRTSNNNEYNSWVLVGACIIALTVLWFQYRTVQAKWLNVPHAPSALAASMAGLGDGALAYRGFGIILQNMGDIGGRVTSLQDYDYNNLASWFNVLHELDSHSNFIPFIAAYYYGGMDQKPEKLPPIAAYLAKAGNDNSGEKWRWLTQAAFMARFKMNDLDLALEYADQIKTLDNPDIPAWAIQLPASILNAKGEKEAAKNMLIGILADDKNTMHPNEVNATIAYICDQILTPQEKDEMNLCQQDY